MKAVVGSVVAAVAASVCCVGPVVAAAIGAGALGAASRWFEPYRPWLLGLTAILLGMAFVTTYRREPATCADGSCAPSSRRTAKVVLWMAVVVVGLLAAFPYYGKAITGVVLQTQAQKQQADGPAQIVTQRAQVVTLSLPEMDCPGCEVGVKIAANKADGVTDVKTNSDTRTAEVTFDPSKTNAEAIASAITKGTGFKVGVPESREKT